MTVAAPLGQEVTRLRWAAGVKTDLGVLLVLLHVQTAFILIYHFPLLLFYHFPPGNFPREKATELRPSVAARGTFSENKNLCFLNTMLASVLHVLPSFMILTCV